MDQKTKKYLEIEAQKIGYLRSNYTVNSITEILRQNGIQDEPKKVTAYSGYANSSEINIYQYMDKGVIQYCAELSYKTDMDSYIIETIIFSRFPSESEVKIARLIDEIKLKFEINFLKEEFKCWKCGTCYHWLDIEGTLAQKYEKWQEEYCGCLEKRCPRLNKTKLISNDKDGYNFLG